jgi:Cu(I)/Ag(I) efflux system membrane fusion protein
MFDAYESDLPWIRMNDKVNFSVQALPGKNFTAKVTYIDPFLDARTRVAKIRVEVPNKNMELKPEMFANGIVDSDVADKSSEILIPKSSILWTGKRAIVYVKTPNIKTTSFKYREIILGPEAGNFYVVAKGLMEGEVIATNGVFKIDAASQLQGLPSMMNPEGGTGSTPHDMSKMDMGGGKKKKAAKKSKASSKNESPAKTPSEFKIQLTAVYDAYIKMKNAFVATDAKKAATMATEVKKAIGNTDMALLKGDAHMMWMGQMTKLNSYLDEIINKGDIEDQRLAFSKFNLVFHKSIKNFGLSKTTAYYQFCPMAFDNEGAFWISGSKEIRNPFFGDKMLGCGETKETLKN